MTPFLRKCQFPEFRCLFRAIALYPWASISTMHHDDDMMDMLTKQAQGKVMRVFPMLDFLDVLSNVPNMINPVNHKRYVGNFLQYFRGKRSPVDPSTFEKDEVVTRYEEVEKDDVNPPLSSNASMDTQDFDTSPDHGSGDDHAGDKVDGKVDDPFERLVKSAEDEKKKKNVGQGRLMEIANKRNDEPLPWATLRLTNYREKFHSMSRGVNFMGAIVFLFMASGYMFLIFGEWSFYTKMRAAHNKYVLKDGEFGGINSTNTSSNASMFLVSADNTTNQTGFTNSGGNGGGEDDDDGFGEWSEELRPLLDFQPMAFILLFSLIPFAIQASALIAENAVAPVLVMATLEYHVNNFVEELDQYLTALAIHKGTLAAPDSGGGGSVTAKKIAMTRDMALSWRMKLFTTELEDISKIINSGVGLMVLNIVCHLVPLNIFMFYPVNGELTCVPSWVVFFTMAQFFGLVKVIMEGIKCNELMNEGVDSLLHNWQLKFTMIGWSGGFIGDATDGGDHFDVFVPKDPEGERQEDIKAQEEKGDSSFSVKIQIEQQHRISSIVQVLKMYEAESITPLSVVGITVTRELLTVIFGFFGAQIIAFASVLADRTMDGTVQHTFVCHANNF
mmetsp:Transcript_69159/g.135956  ORF Transcript_69159/g.135956 Transcript_69159/m.135956 type:complete len:616 (+) Transcript_69159:501-2348(+)